MTPSAVVNNLSRRDDVDEGDMAYMFAPRALGKPKTEVDTVTAVTTPLVATVSPSLVPGWLPLSPLTKVVAITLAGCVAYAVYRVLKGLSETLYNALDLAVDDDQHPLVAGMLKELGVIKESPLPPVRTVEATQAPTLPRPLSEWVEGSTGVTESAAPAEGSRAVAPDTERPSLASRVLARVTGRSAGAVPGNFLPDEAPTVQALREAGASMRGGRGITQETKSMIERVAREEDVPAESLLTMVQLESGGNPNAVSSTGAVGLMQFTRRTARGYSLTNRFDPEANVRAGARLYKDNARYLTRRGLPDTLENVYLMHQLGPRAVQVITANARSAPLSADLQRDMAVNFGNMSAADYVQRNARHLRDAARGATRTVANDTYTRAPRSAPAEGTTTTLPERLPPRQSYAADAPQSRTSPPPAALPVARFDSRGSPVVPNAPTMWRTQSGLLLQVQ